MANQGSTPYNIRKVNGKWVFTDDVFGESAGLVQSELKLVPEDMIPETVYKGGTKGYIPESQIIGYFNSQRFAGTVTSVLSTRGAVSDVASAQASSAANVASTVKSVLSKRNEQSNAALAATASGKTPTRTNVKVDAPDFSSSLPYAQEWANVAGRVLTGTGEKLTSDGNSVYSGQAETFLLPQAIDGRFGEKAFGLKANGVGLAKLQQDIANMDTATIKKWQKALGVPVTGIYTADLGKEVLDLSRAASLENFRRVTSNEMFGNKPLTAMDMLNVLKKGAGGSGSGKSKTYTESSVTEFTTASTGAFLTEMYQNLVGRDPSAQELKQWTTRLNAAAKAAPTTSTATTTQTGGGSSTTRRTKQGFDEGSAQMMVRNQLSQTGESQSLIASTTLYDAFLKAVQNPMG